MKTPMGMNPIQHPDSLDFTDVEPKTVLPGWKRPTVALETLFGKADSGVVLSRRAGTGRDRTVLFLTYENPWGRSGGIAAVAAMLPKELRSSGEKAVRLSPYHRNLKTAPSPMPEPLKSIDVVFDGKRTEVAVYHLTDRGNEEWYLFGADGFFTADGGKDREDPYVYSDENRRGRDGDDSKLLRDGLFAAKAVPQVALALGLVKDLVFHAQDWELASVALTVKEALLENTLESGSVVLTLHNPFDHGLSEANLRRITGRWHDSHWPPINGEERKTILSRMIPLTDAPVSTVSRRFAQEFHQDPLQTGHFAGHYQEILRLQQIVGIDNGLFELPGEHSPGYLQALNMAEAGDYAPILDLKLQARRRMLQELEEFIEKNADRVYGGLDGGQGRPLHALPDDVPVFLMVGRLDPGQKGFDVLNRLVEALPSDFGRFIVSPLSPMGDDAEIGRFLEDLKRVARDNRGRVLVVPFRLVGVYDSLRAGATWSIWPSLYEPFGGVTEFYIHGTPVIARATGGLTQQVVDHTIDPQGASGILYREHPPMPAGKAAWEWASIEQAVDPEKRVGFLLYRRQMIALTIAVSQAVDMYRYDKPAYGRILANLPRMHTRLSWRRSVNDYRAWYDSACA